MTYKYHAERLMKKHTQRRWYPGDIYPICWNVKMLRTVTFDEIFKSMAEQHYHGVNDALVSIPDAHLLRDKWSEVEAGAWDVIMEDMRTTFDPKHSDTMRCCSPKTYKRFSYTPAKSGELWDVEYKFVGRSGGWLALTEFEGAQLEHIDAELGSNAERWYQKLCCMLVEVTWTVDQRYKEYAYLAGNRLYDLVNGDLE